MAKRRVFGYAEAVFDVVYLCTVLFLGTYMVIRADAPVQMLAGIMALVLGGGDAFHLIPRILVAVTGDEMKFRKALAAGKCITSVTMTIFYVILWHIGLMIFSLEEPVMWSVCVYILAFIRIVLSLLPQNGWNESQPSFSWTLFRNIPFFLLGFIIIYLFAVYSGTVPAVTYMWLAVTLSFLFYTPVVIFSNKYPAVGILMIPKTCAYVWIVIMCLFL